MCAATYPDLVFQLLGLLPQLVELAHLRAGVLCGAASGVRSETEKAQDVHPQPGRWLELTWTPDGFGSIPGQGACVRQRIFVSLSH